MLLLRKIRMLWLLVMIVVTPVIALPWNVLGKPIAQQQEDDDDGTDDGEKVAAYAPRHCHGRAPAPPQPRHFAARQLQRLVVASKAAPRLASPHSAPQSTRVRLQI